jgi:hypothetical protein
MGHASSRSDSRPTSSGSEVTERCRQVRIGGAQLPGERAGGVRSIDVSPWGTVGSGDRE